MSVSFWQVQIRHCEPEEKCDAFFDGCGNLTVTYSTNELVQVLACFFSLYTVEVTPFIFGFIRQTKAISPCFDYSFQIICIDEVTRLLTMLKWVRIAHLRNPFFGFFW
jgi:hypothetical protein